MPPTFPDLVVESRARAEADPGWLGTEAHRQLLQAAVSPLIGLDDVSVAWAAPVEGSYWDRHSREIRLRQVPPPDGAAPADAADIHFALTLLHEGTHALFSTPAEAFFAELGMLDPDRRRIPMDLFQRMEDGRLRVVASSERPDFAQEIERHTRGAT